MENQDKEHDASEKKGKEEEAEKRRKGDQKEAKERREDDKIEREIERKEEEERREIEREEDKAWRDRKDEESRKAKEQIEQRWKIEQGLIPLVTCTECDKAIYLVDLSESEKREIYSKSPRLDSEICCLECRKKMRKGQVSMGKCFGCGKPVFHGKTVRDLNEHSYCNNDCVLTLARKTLVTLKQRQDKITVSIKEKKTELANFNKPTQLVKKVLEGFSVEHLSPTGRDNVIKKVEGQLVKKDEGLPYLFYGPVVESVAFAAKEECCLSFEREDCRDITVKLIEMEADFEKALEALDKELLANKAAQDEARKTKEWVEKST